MNRSHSGGFRWFRWTGAVALVSVAAVALRRVADHVGPSDGVTWWSQIRDDLDAFTAGNVSRDIVIRWTVVVMVLTLGWIAVSLVAIVVSYRRSTRPSRLFSRWATFFICGGVMATVSVVAVSPVSASASPMAVLEHESSRQPSGGGPAGDLKLVGTAVVSALAGAGVAIRLQAREQERRRRTGVDEHVETESRVDPIPADVLGELRRAEKRLDEIVDVVTRIRRLAPEVEIRHVIEENDGCYVVEFIRPVKAIPCTELVTNRSVRVRSRPSMASSDHDVDIALPMLMHVGRTMSGEIWVSLDAYRDFGVDCASDEGERVWRHLCDSLVLAPCSLDRGLVSDADLDSIGPRRTFRVREGDLVAAGARRLGESIAVIHADEPMSMVPALRRITTGNVETGLAYTGGEWRLLPIDIAIRPVGTGDDDIRRVRDLLGDPLPVIDITETTSIDDTDDDAGDGWVFMAQVLGPPRVVDRRFDVVEFERGKAEELVIWLAFHPEQRRRSLARTALWLSPVQDATFSNITAAARRSLNAVASPPTDQAWVGITMSDDLPLAPGFVTDVDVLRAAVDVARRRPEDNGLETLRDALQLVRGVPFAGSTYTWSDGIGMSGDAATLVVRAASMMAEMCQQIGDMGGVYWATAKGLIALPGHEDLVAIRLRAHAEHGDRVAMRAEWESYRRAVASEWGDAEPSPKMMDLWRRLGVG